MYLSLRDMHAGTIREFEQPEVRLGRDPASDWQITGEGADVVSGNHARFLFKDGHWHVEDVGSRNGTTVNDKLISHGQPQQLSPGVVIGLGERGPRIRVEAIEKRRVAQTVAEGTRAVRPSAPTMPMLALEDSTVPMQGIEAKGKAAPAPLPAKPAAPPRAAPPPPPPPPPPRIVELTMRETRTDNKYDAKGSRIRLGRGDECELRPLREGDTSVSRVHAEIVLTPDGHAVLRDLKSRNGTYVNGAVLVGDHRLVLEDRIMLGEGGPDLVLEALKLPGEERLEIPKKGPGGRSPEAQAAAKPGPPRRSFAGKGKTVFFREMMEETTKKSAGRLRRVVWSFVFLLTAAVAGFWWYTDQQQRQTAGQFDEQRRALAAASERTQELESALKRAEAAMTQQLAAGDSVQRASQSELVRLQGDLNRASTRVATTTTTTDDRASRAMMDSLRAAIRDQERRNREIAAQMRAVKGVNLAAIAQESGSAVGMVTGYRGADAVWDGSGFAITRSGYFITNKHVATDDGNRADSIFVTLADRRERLRADVIAVPSGREPDLAVLRIRNYDGPVMPRVDWSGTKARQGEAAALIGFPAGYSLAYDRASGTVKTSMSSGIFAQVTEDALRFNGFSVGGSSGSPIFNADGEVVAVHRAGLKESVAEGQRAYGFAVLIPQLIPLLPSDAKMELGLK
jgi:pSer/pThr/pTyr-binding forkhead associated (FHA) protein/S1-C subfamily serine protease